MVSPRSTLSEVPPLAAQKEENGGVTVTFTKANSAPSMMHEISMRKKPVIMSSNIQKEDPIVAELCKEAAQPAQDTVALLLATVTVDIRALVTDVGETSPPQKEEDVVRAERIVIDSDDAVDFPKIEACPDTREVLFIKEEDEEADLGEGKIPPGSSRS